MTTLLQQQQGGGGPRLIRSSDRGDFWAQPVEMLVFASPTGYMMLTSSGLPLLNWGLFYKLLWSAR